MVRLAAAAYPQHPPDSCRENPLFQLRRPARSASCAARTVCPAELEHAAGGIDDDSGNVLGGYELR